MGDPLVTPVIVGALVSALLGEVIIAAKNAYWCKENCKELQATLESIYPHLEQAGANTDSGNVTCIAWLLDFKALLEKAKQATGECTRFNLWKRSKLSSRILLITKQIREKINESGLILLPITQAIKKQLDTLAAASSNTPKPLEFQVQPIPPKIVGSKLNTSFINLKTIIAANHALGKCRIVGLKGQGGAGKTLLAQRLNNDKEMQATFGAAAMLWLTIGLDVTIPSVYLTMGKFLNDGVYEADYLHRNQEDQRTYLKNAFSMKRMLLILDDLWDQKCDGHDMTYWLDIAKGQGSVTLITTRNDRILDRVKAHEKVDISLLDEVESWELFRYYAFEDGNSTSELEKIAKEICKECKGLPLVLRVVGSAMVEKVDIVEWRWTLAYLNESKVTYDSKIVDEEFSELFHRLLFSYNELDDVKKICFLYFAAIPEDCRISIDELYDIWIAEGLFGSDQGEGGRDDAKRAMIYLAKRSLIDWNYEDNYVKIHDILRKLAIHIICVAKPGECAVECFFQSAKVLESLSMINFPLEKKRIFLMNSTILEIPKNFETSHLRVCLLSGSKYDVHNNEMVNLEKLFCNMSELRYLDLSKSANWFWNPTSFQALKEKYPNFGGFEYLTHLKFSACSNMKLLPENIGNLKSLLYLDLSECTSLIELPGSIGLLKALTSLDLCECLSLTELSGSIRELKALTSLNLFRCLSLAELPESIGELKALFRLDLSGCSSLRELPGNIGELKALTSLDLSGCSSLRELPGSIGELKALTSLDLSGCRSLIELPWSIGELIALTSLNLIRCSSMTELPENIGQLNALTSLDLSGWSSLTQLPGSIVELKALTSLDLFGCPSLTELSGSIGELKALTSLDLSWCSSLTELPGSIGELKALTSLNVIGCFSLTKLSRKVVQLKPLTGLKLFE